MSQCLESVQFFLLRLVRLGIQKHGPMHLEFSNLRPLRRPDLFVVFTSNLLLQVFTKSVSDVERRLVAHDNRRPKNFIIADLCYDSN